MGVFTRQQLLDSGVSAGAIDYRARVGTLTRLLPGVYCTGEPSFRDRCVAATLWQPDAVLSHLTAAWWWNLIDDEPEQVHITVPRSTRARCPSWLRAYRRTIRETSFVDTLPVVTIEQCIVDVSASLGGAALEPFVDAALSGSVSKRGLAAQCAKSAGMAGVTEAKKQLRQC